MGMIEMIKDVFTWRVRQYSVASQYLCRVDSYIIYASIIFFLMMIFFEVIRKKKINQIISRYDIKIKISMHILIIFGIINRAHYQFESLQISEFNIEQYLPVIYNLIFLSLRYGLIIYIIWLILKLVKYILIKKISNPGDESAP